MDAKIIADVLRQIRKNVDTGENPVPREAFAAYVAAVPQLVVELIIPNHAGDMILLHRRYDSGWAGGWHTIGGFVRVGETKHQACIRHGKSLGIDITIDTTAGDNGRIGGREDLKHPYGTDNNDHLDQNYFYCKPIDTYSESVDIDWFGKNRTPDKWLRGHEKHMEAFLRFRGL